MSDLVWRPNAGSQQLFLSSKTEEILLEGNRGGGKTEVLIVKFLLGVGRGWGAHYRGVIFRTEFKHLDDVINKSKMLIPQIFPNAKLLESASKLKWIFPDGEELLFRHAKKLIDYEAFKGHSYVFQGFEELTTWAELSFYHAMSSSLRSPIKDILRCKASTTNPMGLGHSIVKEYFIDPEPANVIIHGAERDRVRIHSSFVENPYIFKNDPAYIRYLKNISDPNVKKAWFYGDWDIIAGGAFDDVWNDDVHIIDPEKVEIPSYWKITRSMDWGSSAPFVVCWWATSTGELIKWGDGNKYLPKGTKILLSSWYGAVKGKEDTGLRMLNQDIAKGILAHEKECKYKNVKAGAGDSAMWSDVGGEGKTIYDTLKKNGVKFNKSVKGAGSRVKRMSIMRDMLGASLVENMEAAGIYFMRGNKIINTQIKMLPRDEKNWECVDTNCVDHAYDAITYELLNDATESGMFSH